MERFFREIDREGLTMAIGIGVDLVTVKGDISRMNTVFKFYLQGWVFMALAAAVALAVLFRPWPKLPSLAIPSRSPLGLLLRFGRVSWGAALLLLLASTLVYPILGTGARLQDRFQTLPLTLDGTAYMEKAVYTDDRGSTDLRWDKKAILWLQENVEGSPVILEANTPLYRWGGRVSIYTGLPSVIGWDWHQCQQRYGFPRCPPVEERLRDVRAIYSTPDARQAIALLEKYRVEYIVLGQTEKNYYPEAGVNKFLRGLNGRILLVYHNKGTHIYRFLPDKES